MAVDCLVLNASFEPINLTCFKRAIVLVLKEKAEIIESDPVRIIRAGTWTFPYPLVIKLIKFVEIPRIIRAKVSNPVLFARDDFTCQYCGRNRARFKPREYLTRDHVKPLSRGGKSDWENVVTACSNCNSKKGNRLPMESKMYPKTAPRAPRYIAFVLVESCSDEIHRKYIKMFAGGK